MGPRLSGSGISGRRERKTIAQAPGGRPAKFGAAGARPFGSARSRSGRAVSGKDAPTLNTNVRRRSQITVGLDLELHQVFCHCISCVN